MLPPKINLRRPEPQAISQFLDAGHPTLAFILAMLWLLSPVLGFGTFVWACLVAPDMFWILQRVL